VRGEIKVQLSQTRHRHRRQEKDGLHRYIEWTPKLGELRHGGARGVELNVTASP
jgi:hypothetical protein